MTIMAIRLLPLFSIPITGKLIIINKLQIKCINHCVQLIKSLFSMYMNSIPSHLSLRLDSVNRTLLENIWSRHFIIFRTPLSSVFKVLEPHLTGMWRKILKNLNRTLDLTVNNLEREAWNVTQWLIHESI